MIKRNCEKCNKIFETKESRIKLGKDKFCSKECSKQGISNSLKKLWKNPDYKNNMSIAHTGKTGKDASNWKGGIEITKKGYVLEYVENHPYSIKNKVRQHKLVIERIIGRYLLPMEDVHHINCIKDDNRPENLMAFKHRRYHNSFEAGKYVNPKHIIFDGRIFYILGKHNICVKIQSQPVLHL